jgi:hypothetical protein
VWDARRVIAKLSEHRTQVTILLVSLIIVIVGAFLLRAAADDSLTIDEIFYVHTGVCAFNAGLVDLEPTNPPGPKLLAGIGAELSGVPADTGCTADTYQTLMPNPSINNLHRLVLFARIPAILVTLALILVSALWAFQLGGGVAAVLTAAFVGFDPTIMANGHLATLDIPLTFGFVSCLAALWQWRKCQRDRWLLIAGLALGFALLSKAGAVVLVPIAMALLLVTAIGPFMAGLRVNLADHVGQPRPADRTCRHRGISPVIERGKRDAQEPAHTLGAVALTGQPLHDGADDFSRAPPDPRQTAPMRA